MTTFVFNKKSGLFSNVKARQEVNAALDIEEILISMSCKVIWADLIFQMYPSPRHFGSIWVRPYPNFPSPNPNIFHAISKIVLYIHIILGLNFLLRILF